MKKLSLITLSALSILFSSCLKNDGKDCCTTPFQPYIGYEINGTVRYADVDAKKVGTDSLEITGDNFDAKLTMHVKYTGNGKYALQGNQARFNIKGTGSSVISYNLKADTANKVQIELADTIKKVAQGVFKLNFKRVSPAVAGYPDSIRITRGQFALYLPKN
ncbi:hypothetical protein FFF34_018570 [Inquilinus sp. KBS0705]|nr:hypothetical protein FFF34_018570 [Inquilinus sp. KBS0705]